MLYIIDSEGSYSHFTDIQVSLMIQLRTRSVQEVGNIQSNKRADVMNQTITRP